MNNEKEISDSPPYWITTKSAQTFLGYVGNSTYDLMKTWRYCGYIWLKTGCAQRRLWNGWWDTCRSPLVTHANYISLSTHMAGNWKYPTALGGTLPCRTSTTSVLRFTREAEKTIMALRGPGCITGQYGWKSGLYEHVYRKSPKSSHVVA